MAVIIVIILDPFFSTPAFAQTIQGLGVNCKNVYVAGLGKSTGLGHAICHTAESVQTLPALFFGLSYLFGLFLGVWGIERLYSHVLQPNQVPIWDALKRFLAGGMFFALPMVTEVVQNTIIGTGAGLTDVTISGFSGKTTGSGLDAVLVGFVNDVFRPSLGLLKIFCIIAAVIFTMIGISRLLKTMQEGPRGPGGVGTMMTFLLAGILFSIDSVMGAFSISTFTDPSVNSTATLAYTAGLNSIEVDHLEAVISGVLGFLMLLGFVSFVRGWFIIRDVAEGNQQASMMAGITHIIGGGLAVNMGPLMQAVQETLGLTGMGVTFT